MAIWIMKRLIFLTITISVFGNDINDIGRSIKFEENTNNNANISSSTTTVVFEDEKHPEQDIAHYDEAEIDDIDPKVNFKDDTENFDYEEANREFPNNNDLLFEGNSQYLDKLKDTVKNPIQFGPSSKQNLDASEMTGRVAFIDDKEDEKLGLKKKRKRRRRPKNQPYSDTNNSGTGPYLSPYTNFPGNYHPPSGYPGQIDPGNISQFNPDYPSPLYNPNYQGYPIQPGGVNPSYAQGPVYQGYPDGGLAQNYETGYGLHPGLQGNYRPHRRPKSLANRALSALSEALTSIATNDDYQCVPRLLCEAAGGRASGSSLLQSAAGLEPLLSVLSTYNGVSASPLFVFGRAVFLGYTSKGNTATCRYAYPQCPTNPEKLIFYLNNHNGGFFRFFKSPVPQNSQNVEQFYNQLAGQYGLYNKDHHQVSDQNQNFYSNAQNYGSNYGYNHNLVFGKKEIEDRIQNKPVFGVSDDTADFNTDNAPKWLFPDGVNNINDVKYGIKPSRVSKAVKFPDEKGLNVITHKDYIRKGKYISFPESNTRIIRDYQSTTPVNLNDYVFDYKHNFYVKKTKTGQQKIREDDSLNTVYIVRGNGDPNHPEIVKIRPGQYF